MICAGINTAVENCGFELSVYHYVELPGALWCLGCGVLGWWFGALFSTLSFGSFDFFWCLRRLSDNVAMRSTEMT